MRRPGRWCGFGLVLALVAAVLLIRSESDRGTPSSPAPAGASASGALHSAVADHHIALASEEDEWHEDQVPPVEPERQWPLTPHEIRESREIKRRILEEYGLQILDNDQLPPEGAATLHHAIGQIPPNLLSAHLGLISIEDYYREPYGSMTKEEFKSFAARDNSGEGRLNIFRYSDRLRQSSAYERSDRSWLAWFGVVYHELNHSVWRNISERANPKQGEADLRAVELRDRTHHLIDAAGSDPANYIRSGVMEQNPGYFPDHPVEFIPSIANDYFSSSEAVFLHALDSYEHGLNPHPLSQYLLMLDIYSRGTATSYHYLSTGGTTVHEEVSVGREDNGRVNQVRVGEETYQFELGEDGVVSVEPVLGDVDLDGRITLADADLVERYLAGDTTLSPLRRTAADYDGNGEIDPADHASLLIGVARRGY